MPADTERAYDGWLVASARVGDRRAWTRLIERWQPRFLGHAYRLLGNADQAAEVAQEAWIEVWRGLARLDDAMAFPAWALRIVSRRAAKSIRRRQRVRDTGRSLAREPVTEESMDGGGELHVKLSEVQKALASLSHEQRAVIGLFYLEEMSVAEVSIVLDIPAGTVKTRLMHARQRLRAQLEGDSDEQD